MRFTLHFPGLIVGILLPATPLVASGAGKGQSSTPPSATPVSETINRPLSFPALRIPAKAIFQRVIQARVYHNGTWTLQDSAAQTPLTVARTISSLRPTFVTGLIRLADHGSLSNGEAEAFNTVRESVQTSSKNCRFDIVVNAGDFKTAEQMIRRMREIAARIHPDAWTFYVSPEDASLNPDVFEEGISQAHSHGELVGYDGPLSLIPEGVDYIVVRAWDLKVSRSQIEALREKQRVPLLVELPTTFGNQPNAACTSYTESMSTSERASLLGELAGNQSSWGYHFAYPVLYPILPTRHAFDSTKDNTLLVSIRALLSRFN